MNTKSTTVCAKQSKNIFSQIAYVECQEDSFYISSCPIQYPSVIQNCLKDDRNHYDIIVAGLSGVEIKEDAYAITGEFLDDCNSIWVENEAAKKQFLAAKKHYLFACAIRAALHNGIAKVIDSPHDDGPVCQIGEYWFYFVNPSEDKDLAAAEFCATVSEDAIVEAITDALIDMTYEFTTEYGYYKAILDENGLFPNIC